MIIVELEKRVNEMGNRIVDLEKERKERIYMEVVRVKERKCDKCVFETDSERGLKIHIRRKHTSINNKKYPKACDLCERQFDNHNAMKKHMKQHSYIRAYYKCEDCEFVGENDETMEVHIGKTHSDNLECGLCEVQMDTLENLEMHLFTCEIYVCCSCNLKGKSLSELKSHVVNEQTMEVHLGQAHSEYFECGLCELKVDSSEDLEIHLFTCEIYSCENCDFVVKSLKEIKTHIANKHGNEE